MNTKQLIQAIAANVEAGATLQDAFDAAMGEGKYDEMIDLVLKAIRSDSRDRIVLSDLLEK